MGYAKSELRSTGLHVLLDVGASTLDLCGFVLHEGAEGDRYAFLTSDVQQLGTFRFHQHRLHHLRAFGVGDGQLYPGLLSAGPLALLHDSVQDYLSAQAPMRGDPRVSSSDDGFRTRCRQALVRTILDLYWLRDPHSPRWKDRLPVFLAGGGSRHRLYREAVADVERILKTNKDIQGFHLKDLPKPAALANPGLGEVDEPFLSVAYGLSHERIVIGEIQPPSEIEDLRQRYRTGPADPFVEKDQV